MKANGLALLIAGAKKPKPERQDDDRLADIYEEYERAETAKEKAAALRSFIRVASSEE